MCPTLCDPVDWTHKAPLVHRISQARMLEEWVAISLYDVLSEVFLSQMVLQGEIFALKEELQIM